MYNYLKNIICVSLCVSSLSFLSSLHRTTYQQETRFNAPVSDSSVEHIINDFCENQEELFLTNYSDFVGFYAVTPLRCRFANEDWMEANINAVI